ncbi:hypothetical protein B0H17DRAFT_945056, partial [Mycena rosella]
EVVVKFHTKCYNTTAHTKLAALGLAPKLYYHAAVRGGLLMTVMEKVVGTTAFRWLWVNNTIRLPSSIYTDIHSAIKELHAVDFVFGDLRLPNIMIRERQRQRQRQRREGARQRREGARQRREGARPWRRRRKSSERPGQRGRRQPGRGRGGQRRARWWASGQRQRWPRRPRAADRLRWTAQDGVGRYPATISTSEEWSPAVNPHGLMHKAHDLFSLDLLRKKCI